VDGHVLPGTFPHLWKNLWKSILRSFERRKVLIPRCLWHTFRPGSPGKGPFSAVFPDLNLDLNTGLTRP
jgi:hypothetical protein